MNRTETTAIFIGLILGIAIVFGSFGDMLVVALFGAIGYAVAKIVDGTLDVPALMNRRKS